MQAAELSWTIALAIIKYANLSLKIKKQVGAKRGSLRAEASKARTGFGPNTVLVLNLEFHKTRQSEVL
jgi:hypothetical protein